MNDEDRVELRGEPLQPRGEPIEPAGTPIPLRGEEEEDVRVVVMDAMASQLYKLDHDARTGVDRRPSWDSLTDEEKAPFRADAWEGMRREAVREIVFEIIEEPGKHYNHKDAPNLEGGQESWVDRIINVVDVDQP